MRHSLATVASQLYHSGFSEEKTVHPVLSNYDFESEGLDSYIDSVNSFEKRLAIAWCYDYLIPLREWNECDNTLIITYENLVNNQVNELLELKIF